MVSLEVEYILGDTTILVGVTSIKPVRLEGLTSKVLRPDIYTYMYMYVCVYIYLCICGEVPCILNPSPYISLCRPFKATKLLVVPKVQPKRPA